MMAVGTGFEPVWMASKTIIWNLTRLSHCIWSGMLELNQPCHPSKGQPTPCLYPWHIKVPVVGRVRVELTKAEAHRFTAYLSHQWWPTRKFTRKLTLKKTQSSWEPRHSTIFFRPMYRYVFIWDNLTAITWLRVSNQIDIRHIHLEALLPHTRQGARLINVSHSLQRHEFILSVPNRKVIILSIIFKILKLVWSVNQEVNINPTSEDP